MAIESLNKDNIKDIGNLIFFSEKGYEIPTEKTYAIQWEIIPCSQISSDFIVNPSGHFMFDIADVNKDIITVIDNPGKITNIHATIKSGLDRYNAIQTQIIAADKKCLCCSKYTDSTGKIVYTFEPYEKIVGHIKNNHTGQYIEQTKTIEERVGNMVRITFNTLEAVIVREYPVEYIFKDVTVSKSSSKDINENDSFSYLKVDNLTLTDMVGTESETADTLINVIIENNFSYETLFPCVRYVGKVMQDKVSTEFVAATTFIILENQGSTYERPNFGNSPYNLYFEFLKDSEMKFISTDSIANIIWEDSYTCSVNSTKETHLFDELINTPDSPIYFSVGFQTELEGCYQNIMAMFIKNNVTDQKYLLGLFTFLTEVEGEDERYRALLGNLGIPDPIKYPNIFKEQDPKEQGIDWTIVNNKSKELMISYDNIFPYAGTYKALLGAIKFLGYLDLIFKEWYKIKDLYNKDKYIALQTYDLLNGISLQSKLKKIGVEYGEFERYKKLNRLTMIYHLNLIDEDSTEAVTQHHIDTDGIHVTVTTNVDMPSTYKIYEYRTDEILAKLYSVKLWLERHILGVNCFISDICGEYIVVERFRNLAYVTEHALKDINISGHVSPKIVDNTLFENSQSIVRCSLNEFDSVTFENYEDFSIESFIKTVYTHTKSGQTVFVSPPFETLVNADEYLFKLINKTKTGSLAEFTAADYITNPILIQDNKILFYDDTNNLSKIDKDELPIIEISLANLRYCHGNWNSNIAYSMNMTIDLNTGNQIYTVYDELNDDVVYNGTQKIFLYPFIKYKDLNYDYYNLYWAKKVEDTTVNSTVEAGTSEFIYTSHNRWNVPLIIIRNYKLGNTNDVLEGDFILEIIKGRLLFRNHKDQLNIGKAEGCEVIFGQEYENREQPIELEYMYMSDRIPIYMFDKSKIKDLNVLTQQDIETNTITNRYVDIPVNRIGNYTILVEAYDSYNNIFVNNSDDITVINIPTIPIETILNTEYIINDHNFFEKNGYGVQLSNEEITALLNSIDNNALYPQNYRIYDIDPVLNNPEEIEYDNISYAIDIPKPNDFIIFNNFTERVTNIELDGSSYKISLLDENPNPDTIRCSTHIGLCIYDSLQKSILMDVYPLTVKDIHLEEPTILNYDTVNSYVTVSSTEDDILTQLNDIITNIPDLLGSVNAYVYSANEYIIDDLSDIVLDIENKLTQIIDSEQHFIENQVVKVCITNDTNIHNDYTEQSVDNETSYRIINVEKVGDNYVYTLDGLLDLLKFNNKLYHNNSKVTQTSKLCQLKPENEFKVKICPAHLRAALYVLRVNGYSEEISQKYNKGVVSRTKVLYNPIPLLFNSYLDTTYSALIFNYDPDMLTNIWANPKFLYTNEDLLYVYKDFPVTINKGRILIMRPDINQNILTTNFDTTQEVPLKIKWDWYSYIIDDISNWTGNSNLIDKQLIFSAVNNVLSVTPELLGPQTATMTCYDVFGNKSVNQGDGFVNVDNKTYIVTNKEKSTRPASYKDVYIVGVKINFEPTKVAVVDGETKDFMLAKGTALSASSNSDNIIYNYTVYYSDGTTVENEGFDAVMLTATGKESKTNKVKVKLGKAKHPHKHIATHVHAKLKKHKHHKYDKIPNEIIQLIPIYQYGTSVTTNIFNLSCTIKNIPCNGIEELNNSVLTPFITDINYIQTRSDGEIETIIADNMYDAHLQLLSYSFTNKLHGLINYIPEYTDDNCAGLLKLTVRFYVDGIKEDIIANTICKVYYE